MVVNKYFRIACTAMKRLNEFKAEFIDGRIERICGSCKTVNVWEKGEKHEYQYSVQRTNLKLVQK